MTNHLNEQEDQGEQTTPEKGLDIDDDEIKCQSQFRIPYYQKKDAWTIIFKLVWPITQMAEWIRVNRQHLEKA